MTYRVIEKLTNKEVQPDEVQEAILAPGHSPQFILFPNGVLSLRTHDSEGYHHFVLNLTYEVVK